MNALIDTWFLDIESWVELRLQIEAVTLIWMSHPEEWVRLEALRVLRVFNSPEFRFVICWVYVTLLLTLLLSNIESGVDGCPPFLADILLQEAEESDLVMQSTYSFLSPRSQSNKQRDVIQS